MSKTIQHTLFFPHAPEMVWDYLTRPELMSQWLMPNNFEPVIGHDFQFNTKPIPGLNLDGIFYCRVMEIVPFKKLSYSWRGGPGNGQTSFDTVVNWALVPKDGGTELQLVHRGFEGDHNIPLYEGMTKGWIDNMNKILKSLNEVADGTAKA